MNELILVAAGKPLAVIVLAADASPVERHAAAELQSHLARISGARLPIAPAAAPAQPRILIGRAAACAAGLRDGDWPALGEDGCVVRRAGDALILAGGEPRGTLYAVYEFLERALDCRWLTPDCARLPPRSTIAVGRLAIRHRPPFRYREPFLAIAFDADWAARNRVNGSFYPLDAARGGKLGYAGFVHTFFSLVPPARYFQRHPEYFAEVGGVRTAEMSQLCLTNPAVVEATVQAAREALQQQPEARIVSVSQNESTRWPTCTRSCPRAGHGRGAT
jgi:hypothetical protein